jgi:membrane protein
MGVVAVHGAARDGSRGRTATHPLEVPVRGWKDVLFRVWKNIGKDRLLLVGAGASGSAVLR